MSVFKYSKKIILGATVLLIGCQSSYLSQDIQQEMSLLPSPSELAVPELKHWLTRFNDPQLPKLVGLAIDQNFNLQQAADRVSAAQQQAIISGAPQLPEIGIYNSNQRQKISNSNYSNNYQAGVELSWEIDLWGKLRDNAKAGNYLYAAEQVDYEAARLSLAGMVTKSWFDVLTQQALAQLLEQRVNNIQANTLIIESGYRQGINSALDLYLARADLAAEKSQRDNQVNVFVQAIRNLEILLGEYPDGKLDALTQELKLIEAFEPIPANIPAKIVYQRNDIRAAFLQLQAADYDVAAAHKSRYPSLRITGGAGDSSDEFKDLFDQSSLAWNIVGGLTQPLYAGGKLKAQEQKKLFELRQKEKQYMESLYTAYNELFTSLDNEKTLQQQLLNLIEAKENSEAAYKLAFERYQNGLQEYTAVLEAQRRAFATQNAVILIKRNLLQNRVNFYLATGTEF